MSNAMLWKKILSTSMHYDSWFHQIRFECMRLHVLHVLCYCPHVTWTAKWREIINTKTQKITLTGYSVSVLIFNSLLKFILS